MDKDQELANKVDALITKHGFGESAVTADERNIPLLTEVVAAPEWDANAVARQATAMQQLSDDEIDAMSHEIFSRVFDRIDLELAAKLERRLAEQLTTHINAVVTHVLGDLRQDIANEIGDAVNAALAERLRKPR